MNARKWINNCFAGCFSASLISFAAADLKADSGFIPQSQLKSKYSMDIASIDYSRLNYSPVQIQEQTNSFSLPDDRSLQFQRNAGKAVYKAMTMSHKKLAKQLAGAALLYSFDKIEMTGPLKDTFFFVKEKTKFKFGKCSQIRFSTKRLKARSCFFDNQAKLEFRANYKMDSFRLKFNWPL